MTAAGKAAAKAAIRKNARKTTSAAKTRDLGPVFFALRGLLAPYENALALKTTNPGYCCLESRTPTYKNRPMFFAAVRAGKNYVSYHLMPVYGCRDLLEGISPELKRRMQGKACFNFNVVDEPLFNELARLTRAGYEKFKNLKYL